VSVSAAKIILDSVMPTLAPWQGDERTVDAERSEAEPLPPEPMTQHQD